MADPLRLMIFDGTRRADPLTATLWGVYLHGEAGRRRRDGHGRGARAADVTTEQVTGQPTLQVVVDRAAAARHGIGIVRRISGGGAMAASTDTTAPATEAHGAGDFNIMLMTEYKDLATMEANEDKADNLAQQVVGNDAAVAWGGAAGNFEVTWVIRMTAVFSSVASQLS